MSSTSREDEKLWQGGASRLFLLDVTCAEVRVSNADHLSKLREGRLYLDAASCEIRDRQSEPNRKAFPTSDEVSYVTHLWCRDADGGSACVVVVDSLKVQYRLLKEGLSAESADRMLGALNGSARGLSFKIVEAYTTSGWCGRPDAPLERRRLAWLAVEQTRDVPEAVLNDTLKGWASYLEARTAESRVGLDAQSLERIDVKPGEWLDAPRALARRPKGRYCCDAILHATTKQLRRSSDQSGLPALRILSFDIECYGRSGFPDARNPEDECIAIGIWAETFYSAEASKSTKVLCLGETRAEGDYVESCRSEAELIRRFAEVLQQEGPDVIVGYNQTTFDWRYLRDRSKGEHYRLSKLTEAMCEIRSSRVSSSAMGDNPLTLPRIPGAFEIDLWFYLKRENPPDLANLKLDTVARHFLGETKHDLPPQEIFKCYRSGPEGRGRVAAYCLQDTRLVLDLVRRLDVLPRVLLMARVVGVTPRDVLLRGQQIRVYSQLLRKAHALGFVVEDGKSRANQDDGGEADGTYEGAHVLDPVPGFFREPVLTLDFASLYPSIQRTFNLSPETLVTSASDPELPRHCVPGTEHVFVSASHTRGILPLILEELLAERARAKKEMAKAEGLQRALLNGKQLALKVSANSVYGFCGAQGGMLQCREVAESTTAVGRRVISFTSELIEREYPGARIVYGDTDSCFVQLQPEKRGLDARGLFAFGEAVAERVNEAFAATLSFPSYVRLEMEKFLNPLILYPAKKRYAGMCFEDPEKPGKPLVRGLELVRKDGIPLTKDCQQRLIELLLRDPDGPAKAAEIVRALIARVLTLEPGDDLSCLAQSKSLRAEYKAGSLPHVEVNALKKRRQPGSESHVGDRVAFVVIASASETLSEKAEDVAFAAAHRLPPDWSYYLEAVEKPIMRVLSVPLRSFDESLYETIRRSFEVAREQAAAKVRAHCMARSGLEWVPGRATKGGRIQSFLSADIVGTAHVSAPRAAPKKRCLSSKAGSILEFTTSRPRTGA